MTEEELTNIERRLRELVSEASDSGGQSLAQNANWTASALARVCEALRELQEVRRAQGHPWSARAVCRCALCTGDYRAASAVG